MISAGNEHNSSAAAPISQVHVIIWSVIRWDHHPWQLPELPSGDAYVSETGVCGSEGREADPTHHHAQVRLLGRHLHGRHGAELLLGLVGAQGGGHHAGGAGGPVGGGRNADEGGGTKGVQCGCPWGPLQRQGVGKGKCCSGPAPVVGSELQGVDDAQDLVKVAAGGGGVEQRELELLVGADDEHGCRRSISYQVCFSVSAADEFIRGEEERVGWCVCYSYSNCRGPFMHGEETVKHHQELRGRAGGAPRQAMGRPAAFFSSGSSYHHAESITQTTISPCARSQGMIHTSREEREGTRTHGVAPHHAKLGGEVALGVGDDGVGDRLAAGKLGGLDVLDPALQGENPSRAESATRTKAWPRGMQRKRRAGGGEGINRLAGPMRTWWLSTSLQESAASFTPLLAKSSS